jgi:hypothetical protein
MGTLQFAVRSDSSRSKTRIKVDSALMRVTIHRRIYVLCFSFHSGLLATSRWLHCNKPGLANYESWAGRALDISDPGDT